MGPLPRSVLLAAWGSAVLTGREQMARAINVITGEDEPHVVSRDGAPPEDGDDLLGLLSGWAARGVREVAVRLPVPGDLVGLAGPASFNTAALASGECVVAGPDEGGRTWGAVPEVMEFGSEGDRGYLVTWHVQEVAARQVTDIESVAEAALALRQAVLEAADDLDRLDVARWGPRTGDLTHGLVRDSLRATATLPADTPPRCIKVITSALELRAVVALAEQDDGGSITSAEAAARAGVLRRLDGVARRGLVAAVNAASM